jgi:thioredoxin reductase (NADPH)
VVGGGLSGPDGEVKISCPVRFAVGDLRSGSTERVAAAVAEGSAAVRAVHECLAFAR